MKTYITIQPNGEIKVEAQEIIGEHCLNNLEFLTQLGESNTELKQEYYQEKETEKVEELS